MPPVFSSLSFKTPYSIAIPFACVNVIQPFPEIARSGGGNRDCRAGRRTLAGLTPDGPPRSVGDDCAALRMRGDSRSAELFPVFWGIALLGLAQFHTNFPLFQGRL